MFKVFIYLYIFLESVLCKTWFWLFAQSGEVGAAVTVAVVSAAEQCPRLWPLREERGAPCTESEGAAQDHLAYLVLTGECHPCQERTVTTGSETALCLQPTLPVLFGQLPLWGGAPAFFFFPDSPPFSTQIPQSMQRVLQGLEVVPDLPSPKVQPAPCGLIRALQAWCHPGGCYLMVLPTCGVMELRVPLLSRGW